MADAGDDDLFADLYDGEADEPETKPEPTIAKSEPDPTPAVPDASEVPAAKQEDEDGDKPFDPAADDMQDVKNDFGNGGYGNEHGNGNGHGMYGLPEPQPERPLTLKDDGKMFIGGLNWETTDQSLKDYFTQFGEVTECTVMRDGSTGRSRGFGFLTFKDPKVVNVVMVKEHLLDGKLIDPKRAIPRDEQEKTSKIFVGGVSQEATETDFRQFFAQFGNVLDCTLMMDKDTGRPRGFGFVTFDDDVAVERALSQQLAIHGKLIEVKRAEPRGNLREEGGGGGRGGRFGGGGRGGGHAGGFGNQQDQAASQQGAGGATNGMTPAMMAQYWQRMQQYFQMMQTQMAAGGGGGMNPQMAAMQQNPAMMQQMMASMGRGNGGGGGQMNPQMMQQMAAMQGGGNSPNANVPAHMRPGFNAQEQLMFEQQKYERQNQARMSGYPATNSNNGNTWDGMYDDVPAPSPGPGAGGRGNFSGRGGRGGGFGGSGGGGGGGSGGFGGGAGLGGSGRPGSATPMGPGSGSAPINAPTGPKNAGVPGSNYRGGGRGGRGMRTEPYGRGAK